MKFCKCFPIGSRKCLALFISFIFSAQYIFSQEKLPLIKATSKSVDIKDGNIFQKNVWNLSPEISPDIYYALHPETLNTITFYTDIDSISFSAVAGNTYDFIILLNNKDTCFTRISTSKPAKETGIAIDPSILIDPVALKEDFTVFRNALQYNHAGLYRYKTKKELDRLFDSCLSTISHPMTQLEFGKVIMFLLSSISDGHTGTNLSRILINYYSENVKLFPLNLLFVNNRAYLLCSRLNDLAAGTEILAIDNKPINEIVKQLFQYLPSDGKIETKKTKTLNKGAFPFLYNLIFGNKNSFLVRYKGEQGDNKLIYIQAQFVKDFECDDANSLPGIYDLQLQYPQNNTALLTIKTFDERRLAGKQNFREFLDSAFKEINFKKINNVIIDLRGNGGGEDKYGALLYSYLTTKPFKYFASIETTTRKIQEDENSLLGVQQSQKNSFNGKVLFLINGLSFSTTADFCAIAKSNSRGKFIGEETGGAYYGNTSGQTVITKLVNTGIDITIPKFKYVNDVAKSKYPDRGIIPDYSVMPTVVDVLKHQDVQLNFALKLIKGK